MFTLGIHAGALLLVFMLPVVGWITFGLAALIGVSLCWQLRYGIGASAGEINLAEDGSCIRMTQGRPQSYRIVQANIYPGFIRLTLRRSGERTRMQFLSRDSVEPEIYRTLSSLIAQRRLSAVDPALKQQI